MYPRRVKDLPHFDIDSDDEYKTPLKQNHKQTETMERQDQNGCNKENKHCSFNARNNNNSAVNNSGTFSKLRMYPKRSSELPSLEPDSEEDDNNLNCAILNDSFIISPTKSDNNDSDARSSPDALRENPTSKMKDTGKNEENAENLSFLKRFNEMALSSDKNLNKSSKEFQCSAVPLNSQTSNKENTSFAQLQRFNSEPTPQQQNQQQLQTRVDLETPFKSATSGAVLSAAQFITPQVRAPTFSLQRRPPGELQKNRSAIDNEFRTQKVLFQTPMSVARACLPNDSITLSLCDSINEQITPKTNEKTPQIVDENVLNTKSKKSLVVAFNKSENVSANAPQVSLAEKSTTIATALSSSVPSNTSVTNSTVATTNESVLEINNAKYAIIKKLGAGGSSSVYLAQRKDNGKECALKIVDLQGDAAVIEGYLNETKLLAKLQGNACVVSLYEYELLRKESKLYMIMEKGDSDLNKILQNYKTHLPLYVLMNYWYQMLQAVNYIHQNGVIHSDLKPANFLMVNGRLKLIDFGIASNIAIDSTSIIKFSQAGTFNYISPEALTDTSTGSSPIRHQPKIKISTKSDVWSLGCILYLLLYKRTPFSHILNIYAKISAISNPSHAIDYPAIPFYYPSMLVHMVKKCLQHNPKQRPSCDELLQYPFNMVIPIQNLTVPQK